MLWQGWIITCTTASVTVTVTDTPIIAMVSKIVGVIVIITAIVIVIILGGPMKTQEAHRS